VAISFVVLKIRSEENADEVWHRITGSFFNGNWWLIVVAFVLVFFNWGLEGYKWKRLMHSEYPISTFLAVKAAFAGNATGAFTPNRVGGFIGRVMYLPKDKVLIGTLNTFVGNLAQLIATIVFGAFGVLIIHLLSVEMCVGKQTDLVFWILALVIGFCSLVVIHIYFFTGMWMTLFFRLKWFKRHEEKFKFLAQHSKLILAEVLFYSLVRYLIFAFQFYLTLSFFDVEIDFTVCLALIGYLYLTITLVPTFLGKLGVRESAAGLIFCSFSPSVSATTMASLLLWMLNVAIATTIGGILTLFIKKDK
jgi:hypothetical protein